MARRHFDRGDNTYLPGIAEAEHCHPAPVEPSNIDCSGHSYNPANTVLASLVKRIDFPVAGTLAGTPDCPAKIAGNRL